jgi:uncharacterized protein YegL
MQNFDEQDDLVVAGLNMTVAQDISGLDLQTEVATITYMCLDVSGSMSSHVSAMNQALNEFKNALVESDEADSMVLIKTLFGEYLTVGSPQKIAWFDPSYTAKENATSLYDAIVKGAEDLKMYIQQARDDGHIARSVFVVFTDGEDNNSKASWASAKAAVEELLKQECIACVFIAFGLSAKGIATRLGFQPEDVLECNSTASDLRKAFNYTSKRVSQQSQGIKSTAVNPFGF